MSARTEARLWVAQRASAAVLGVFVLVHLITIVYAMHGGLTAAEILARTRGSVPWATFYGLFVAAVAIHAPIGLRAVLAEWLHLRGRLTDALLVLLGMVLALWGLRAVWAVFAP